MGRAGDVPADAVRRQGIVAWDANTLGATCGNHGNRMIMRLPGRPTPPRGEGSRKRVAAGGPEEVPAAVPFTGTTETAQCR